MAKKDILESVVKKVGYNKPSAVDVKTAAGWKNNKMDYDDGGLMGRGSDFAGKVRGNLEEAASLEGRSVLGMAGSHAIRGAAFGAVGGGTVEAAQGGSFWDGAKQGAVNGAAGWTGLRMGMKGVGATSRNAFKGNNEGMLSAGANMWKSTSGKGEVSGQARAILNNRQMEGVARQVMNQSAKDAKR